MKMVRLTILCISLIIISLILAGQSAAKIAPKSVMGAWLFDEDTGNVAKDSTKNGNHGKLMNGPKLVKGQFGQAIEFDGSDDYVDMGDPANGSLDFGTNDFSVAWWFKTTSQDKFMLSKKAGGGNPAGFHAYLDSPGWHLRVRLANGATNVAVSSNTANLHDDQWHHGAFVRSGDRLYVYVDGSEDNSIGGVGNLDVSSTTNFYVGRMDNYYPGLLDELVILSVALTEDDIKSIMNQGSEKALGITAVGKEGKLTTTWAGLKNTF